MLLIAAVPAIRSHPESSDSGRPAASSTPSECDRIETREACRQITVDGHVWRYTLRQPAVATADTVVLDLGGPGMSALSGAFNLGTLSDVLPDLVARFNLIIVEEPWVTATVPPACDRSLVAYYHGIRSGDRSAAADVGRDCKLGTVPSRWGFSPSTYTRVIRAIAAQHQLALKGFVGHSFGSVRLAYGRDLGFQWAVLGRPYPYTAGLGELIHEQASALDRLQAKLRRAIPGPLPPKTDERSVPITEFDRLSAIVELGYLDESMASRLGQHVLDGTDTTSIGLMSDTLWSRYGVESMSSRMLSFWDEVCAVAGSAGSLGTRASPLETVMTDRYAVCASAPTYQPSIPTGLRLCVVDAADDPVTPRPLVRRTFPPGGSTVYMTADVSSHTSMIGLNDCVKTVGNT